MMTGWTEYKGNWYYLDETGAMVLKCKLEIDGKEYTFDKDGICLNR
jgi:glucan-binding YG repeat protein